MVIADLLLPFQYKHFYRELHRIQKAVDVVREIRNDHCVKLQNRKMQNDMREMWKSMCVKLENVFRVCMKLET